MESGWIGATAMGVMMIVAGCRDEGGAVTPELDGEGDTTTSTDTRDGDATPAGYRRAALTPLVGPVENPGRGFYAFVSELTEVSAEELADVRADGLTLVYSPVRLDAYRDSALPQGFLDALAAGLGRVRAAGLGLVLRFAYNYPETEQDYLDAQDAARATIEGHIAQLAPLISRYADVVTFWQAGFIGAWGEWHTSSHGLEAAAPRDAIHAALLEALPAGEWLQARYPGDLARWYGEGALSEARVGFHNDCFLSSPDDVGTFEGGLDDPMRAFVARLGEHAPFGGETCDAEAADQQRRGCADILAEGARYHLTYLNRDYFRAFHETWEREGCLGQVRDAMGYRLVLGEVDAPEEAAGRLRVVVVVDNVGWARPFVGHELAVTLRRGEAVSALPSGMDVGRFSPGRQEVSLEVALEGVAPGTYALGVAAIEPGTGAVIRFANADAPALGQRWVEGRFEVGLEVTIR